MRDLNKIEKRIEKVFPAPVGIPTINIIGVEPAWKQMNISADEYFTEASRRGIHQDATTNLWPVFQYEV